MTTVLQILENLEKEADIDVSKLEKTLKLTKKLDRDKLHIAIRALTKLGIVRNIYDDKISINNEVDFWSDRVKTRYTEATRDIRARR